MKPFITLLLLLFTMVTMAQTLLPDVPLRTTAPR